MVCDNNVVVVVVILQLGTLLCVWQQELSAETERYRANIDEYNKVFYEMKKRKDQLQCERK